MCFCKVLCVGFPGFEIIFKKMVPWGQFDFKSNLHSQKNQGIFRQRNKHVWFWAGKNRHLVNYGTVDGSEIHCNYNHVLGMYKTVHGRMNYLVTNWPSLFHQQYFNV